MTEASAPGKLILFGEHAVVYNRPAMAVPITQVQAKVVITPSERPEAGIWIDAPDVSVDAHFEELPPGHALGSIIKTVLQALNLHTQPHLHIRITSSIPVACGLGSGAAVSVALIRALSDHLGLGMDDQQVNALCFETERFLHGTPSGIDNTVITYARPVYFIKGQPIETFQAKTPFTLVVADTGILATTKESVGDVRKLWEAHPEHWNGIFDRVAEIVRQARHSIETGEWQKIGALMDANHALLQEMTVSSHELDKLVVTARDAGALGAKLSGGGRGGNMIALVNPQTTSAEKVAAALQNAGAKRTIITTVQ